MQDDRAAFDTREGWSRDVLTNLPQNSNDADLERQELSAVLAEFVDFYRLLPGNPLRLARTSRTKSPVIRGGAKFWRSKEA